MKKSLESYQKSVERALQQAIEQLGDPSPLRDACAYALLSEGKRLRPILVLLIAESLNQGRDVIQAALSVEYFHTASLIADDLPCMDNDDMRRNRPSLHKVYEESVAILASYTLIAAGYGGIYEASRAWKETEPHKASHIDAIAVVCLKEITQCAGLRGATYGQYLDLFPLDASYETMRLVIERKTASLFEISFVLGWLFGGGDLERLNEVKKAARHLGVAFQLADDLQDFIQDQNKNNVVHALGEEAIRKLFDVEYALLVASLQSLGLWSSMFQTVCIFLKRSNENFKMRSHETKSKTENSPY